MTRNLAIAALLLSVLALALSVKRLIAEPGSISAPPATVVVEQVCVEQLRQVELRLAARIADNERRLNGLGNAVIDAGVRWSEAPVALPERPLRQRFVRVDTGSSQLSVTQEAEGGFSAVNTDPSQTGKHVMVKALQSDGGVQLVPIVVPAPAQ